MQGIASYGQANNETNTDENARGEGESSPHERHDSKDGEQEPNKGEDDADAAGS